MKPNLTALDYARWFVQKRLDDPRNSFEGNMKLLKLLYFAQLINIAKNDRKLFNDPILAYDHGCVIESIRKAYHKNHALFIREALDATLDINELDLETLDITAHIFGHLSAEQLSALNHCHPTWKKARRSAEIVFDDRDIQKMKDTLQAYKETQRLNMIQIRNRFFHYDPDQLQLTTEVKKELEEFNGTETHYSVYRDENLGLIIY